MAKREDYEVRTEGLVSDIINGTQITIYDVEYVKEGGEFYLRIYIDKEGGVTIEDCEFVSRALSQKLDEDEFIEDGYILEVSSPGLGRTLKKDRHLEKSIGQEAMVKLYKPIDGQKEFVGVLDRFDKESVVILIEDGEISFNRSDIAVIKLTLDF